MVTEFYGNATVRTLSKTAQKSFFIWTLFWWGSVGVLATMFYVGKMDFVSSCRIALYGVSIWLNACVIVWLLQHNSGQDKLALYHDMLVIWMLSYAITNITWEIPWVMFSPFVFDDMHTIEDIVAQTGYMRENLLHMYWWILGSFGAVDLRTVNHNATFYTIEIYAVVNLVMTAYFFYLNNKRSVYRYLIPVISSGAPVVATFVFSFSEVFADFENMPGGVADTLLALVWTQYQYVLFPLVFGYLGLQLLQDDWQQGQATQVME